MFLLSLLFNAHKKDPATFPCRVGKESGQFLENLSRAPLDHRTRTARYYLDLPRLPAACRPAKAT